MMTEPDDTITEIDMEAYTDGLLGDDPNRTAAVERLLEQRPDLAAQINVYQTQIDALRRAFEPFLHEPIPDRLYSALLKRKRRSPVRTWLRAAAIAGLVVGASALTWVLASHTNSEQSLVRQMAALAYDNFVRPHTSSTHSIPAPVDTGPSTRDPDRLFGHAAIPSEPSSAGVPDLSSIGFRLEHQELLEAGAYHLTKLTYGAADGRRFSLYIPSMLPEPDSALRVDRKGDVHIAYWPDSGSLSVVVSRLPLEETRTIARAVKHALIKLDRTVPLGPAPPGNEANLSRDGLVSTSLGPEVPSEPKGLSP